MSLELPNLDDEIRVLMLEEIDLDIEAGTLYISKRLKRGKEEVYINLLKDSISNGNCNLFVSEIANNNCLLTEVPDNKTKSGIRKVPKDAHITLGEGEYNRFYIRALCRKSISYNNELEIFRAKTVRNPRSASQAKIGQTVNPKKLLEDLRKNIGIDTALGIPAGPNSGLSVRIKN